MPATALVHLCFLLATLSPKWCIIPWELLGRRVEEV